MYNFLKMEIKLSTSDNFKSFIGNLNIDIRETITTRYGEITSALNKEFRNTESKTNNCLQVGSYGRFTAIKNISDLDMLYIMPKNSWDIYKNGKQYNLLCDAKDAILKRFPRTKVFVDRLVVRVLFKNFHIEVQPVFEIDNTFSFPDTYKGGKWRITKPREEITAISTLDKAKNNNLRPLCKMTRAWKNKLGVAMGGLLIDTLAYNYLNTTNYYDDKSYLYYDYLCRDFFKYLSELPKEEYYAALGSGQRVIVKSKFQNKAKKTYNLILKAIESDKNKDWKKVFGRPFPSESELSLESVSYDSSQSWKDTEEFIEDKFPVDIRNDIQITCNVLQDGFRETTLRNIILKSLPLKFKKSLKFKVNECDIEDDYELYWKVLNRGDVAKSRDEIRGNIIKDQGHLSKTENTKFIGDHIVECFAVQNDVVVAKDRIHVPISG